MPSSNAMDLFCGPVMIMSASSCSGTKTHKYVTKVVVKSVGIEQTFSIGVILPTKGKVCLDWQNIWYNNSWAFIGHSVYITYSISLVWKFYGWKIRTIMSKKAAGVVNYNGNNLKFKKQLGFETINLVSLELTY